MSLNKIFVLVSFGLFTSSILNFFEDLKTKPEFLFDAGVIPETRKLKDIDEFRRLGKERKLGLVDINNKNDESALHKKIKKKNSRDLKSGQSVFQKRKPKYFIKAGSEHATSISFNPSTHNSDNDYFTLTLLPVNPGKARLNALQSYLNQWMKLDLQKENLSVYQMKIGDKLVDNRFKVLYVNKSTGFQKWYYFDINFQDDKIDMDDFKNNRHISVETKGDYSYDREYVHTLNKDCSKIKQSIKNALKMECSPYVNQHNYVVKGVYDITLEVTKKNRKGVFVEKHVYVTTAEIQNKNSKNKTDDQASVSGPKSIYERLKDYYANKSNQLKKDFKRSEIKKKTTRAEVKIDLFYENMKKRNISQEKEYVNKVKDDIWLAFSEVKARDRAHKRTMELLRTSAEEINAFNIDLGIRMMNHLIDYMDKYKAYNYRSNVYNNEIKITRLVDYLDYLWYLRDKELDDHYEKYLRN